jgi:phosphohistidine phosphatase
VKTLFVLRHAKASSDSASGSDFDRPLASRGLREAAAVGRALRARDVQVDAIVASPALRVAETVAAVIHSAGWTLAPLWDRRIYNASAETLLAVIRELDDVAGAALIVGHNPGLHELVLQLAEDGCAQVGAAFPTATLAELRLTVDQWADVGLGSGCIQSVVRPKDLDGG